MTVNNTVLGGIERVKQLLAYGKVEQKIDALLDAFEYGEAGLDLIIEALKNSEFYLFKFASFSNSRKRL
ncbi:MAG: hypothetical protein HWQ43_10065 [Nostoc sp. JL31]|uniref:hypothetical protein n=1 Tax=Nostoc sp. JL31 TaxID=2815395 RepID=UPI0025FE00EB|nr:hypothetical protein [Nostoc sp. JL31]MBN3889490.1 hypothetical protein [Nostoc sp. JL31]